MSEIDYSEYNLRELYESQQNVNKQRHPRNAELIEYWIKIREGEMPLGTPEPEKKIVPPPVVQYESVDPVQREKENEVEPETSQFYSRASYLYASSKGRIGRLDYWMGGIPIAIMAFAVEHFIMSLNYNLYLGIILSLSVPGCMLGIKRAHDRNKSGWFTILFLVPIVSFWPIIELGFFKGTAGNNKYGIDPIRRSKRA